MNSVRVSQAEVKPATAKAFLGLNMENNRRVSAKQVKNHVLDMKSGNWRQTGEAIHFHRNGKLVNGQHRLTAVVEAGLPQKFVIVRGLTDADVLALDNGRKRSTGDRLSILGMPHLRGAAQIVNSLHALGKVSLPTPSQLVNYTKNNVKGLEKVVDMFAKCKGNAVNTKPVQAVVFAALQHAREADVREFVNIYKGEQASPSTPREKAQIALDIRNSFITKGSNLYAGHGGEVQAKLFSDALSRYLYGKKAIVRYRDVVKGSTAYRYKWVNDVDPFPLRTTPKPTLVKSAKAA